VTIEPAVISPELLPDIKTPGQTKRPHASDYWVLTKPDVNLLILVTVGAGFCLARPTGFQGFPWVRLFHTLFGTSLVASGSGVLNQVAERRFDSLMRRTARRPLASGRIAPLGALWFGIFLSAAGAIYLAFAVNLLAGLLALLTLTLYLGIYTPLKRKTSFCTLVGAIPGAIPPLIGWAAASGCLSAGAWILYATLFLWQFPHFMSIAWMYREDYARAGYLTLPRGRWRDRSMALQSLLPALALIPICSIPALLGQTGVCYAVLAPLLSLAFFCESARLPLSRSNAVARQLLHASILYLPAVFLLMVLDRK